MEVAYAAYAQTSRATSMPTQAKAVSVELKCDPSTESIIAHMIVLSSKSPDGLMTYVDLWNALYPQTPWRGHGALHIIGKVMGRVTAHCVDQGLPILTTLIVQKGTRRMSEFAMKNVFAACKERGMKTDHVNAIAFCPHQQTEAIRYAKARR